MDRIPVFVSFDYRHDRDLKNGLIEQANRRDAPFWIKDRSIERAIDAQWEAEAERRVASCKVVLVICGANVHNSPGITKEVQMAHRLGKPIHLLDPGQRGRSRPIGVPETEPFVPMDWSSLRALFHGR